MLKSKITLLILCFLLAACESRSGFLGVRSTPNEFKAYQNSELDVPEKHASKDQLPKPSEENIPLKQDHVSPQSQAQKALKNASKY